MTLSPRERVVVVTGGAHGIGAEICRYYAERQFAVAVVDADANDAGTLAHQLREAGATVVAVTCDVSEEQSVELAFATIDKELGPLDVLVNNAGINLRHAPLELGLQRWNRVLQVNLTGYFLCAMAAGRRMTSRGSGAIVNVSSIAGTTALGRGNLAHAVSKGGIDALTRELAIEWASHGIRVNGVAPCQVATAGFLASESARVAGGDESATDYRRGIPLGRLAEPREIAAAVYFLTSEAAAMITGVVLPVDGGNLAFNAGGTLS